MRSNRHYPLILIADDDPLLAALLRRYFQPMGYDVASVSDGAAALDFIAREAPDVVILDSMMPVMSGGEVLLRLKAQGLVDGLRIVVLTTLSQEEHVLTALRLGAADFIAKPFSPDELVLRVKRLLLTRAA
jgi:DNA-binding response OmpR family regulator